MTEQSPLGRAMLDRGVHRLIMRTALKMCGAFYEASASKSDAFYKRFPKRREFIRAFWPHFVPQARITLASMLGMNHITDHMKEEIFEALQLDHSLNFHHRPKPRDTGRINLQDMAGVDQLWQ